MQDDGHEEVGHLQGHQHEVHRGGTPSSDFRTCSTTNQTVYFEIFFPIGKGDSIIVSDIGVKVLARKRSARTMEISGSLAKRTKVQNRK